MEEIKDEVIFEVEGDVTQITLTMDTKIFLDYYETVFKAEYLGVFKKKDFSKLIESELDRQTKAVKLFRSRIKREQEALLAREKEKAEQKEKFSQWVSEKMGTLPPQLKEMLVHDLEHSNIRYAFEIRAYERRLKDLEERLIQDKAGISIALNRYKTIAMNRAKLSKEAEELGKEA